VVSAAKDADRLRLALEDAAASLEWAASVHDCMPTRKAAERARKASGSEPPDARGDWGLPRPPIR
jgi:hypothetical protein